MKWDIQSESYTYNFLPEFIFEINGCHLGDFSKLKNLQAPKYLQFRNFFEAKLEKCFIVPANTFDNVKGDFPIGFKLWNTGVKERFQQFFADVYDNKGIYIGKKNLLPYDNIKSINDWVKTFRFSKSEIGSIATITGVGSDFQHNNTVCIEKSYKKVAADNHHWQITKNNLIQSAIYLTIRKIIPATWLNDRDLFLYPNDGWQSDIEFQNDCLAFTLFSNDIQSKFGVNNWIPFTEQEVNAREKFESNFMSRFIQGKLKTPTHTDLFNNQPQRTTPFEFSATATEGFDAGRNLWKYYHSKPDCNVNASLYDIREYFQGRNDKGKMNNKSNDEAYMKLIGNLREKLKLLAEKIAPKVYAYGFLKE